MSELKQLQFVDASGRYVAEFAEGVYCRVRSLVPGFLLNPVEYTESVVSPYYGKAQTLAHNVLVHIDSKVNYGVTKSQCLLKVNVVGEKGAEEFQEAKNKYVTVAVDMYQFVRKNGVTGIVHNRGEAFEHIKATLISAIGATASGVQATLENVAHQPAVQKAVNVVKPYAEIAQNKYAQLHSALVHTPQYALLYKVCNDTFVLIATNPYVKGAYEKSKDTVYPYIQFVADPAVEQVTPYVEKLKEHLQPAPDASHEAASELPASNAGGGGSGGEETPAPTAVLNEKKDGNSRPMQ